MAGKRDDLSSEYLRQFYERLTALRMQKNVSAREMSLALGQSESYINKIENRHTLPSFPVFLYICDYFDITPVDFFRTDQDNPRPLRDLINDLEKLTPEQVDHVRHIVKDILKK